MLFQLGGSSAILEIVDFGRKDNQGREDRGAQASASSTGTGDSSNVHDLGSSANLENIPVSINFGIFCPDCETSREFTDCEARANRWDGSHTDLVPVYVDRGAQASASNARVNTSAQGYTVMKSPYLCRVY